MRRNPAVNTAFQTIRSTETIAARKAFPLSHQLKLRRQLIAIELPLPKFG
jgi:hypothetical protein